MMNYTYYIEPCFLLTLLLSFIIVVCAHIKGKVDKSAVLASGLVGVVVMFSLLENWPFIYTVLAFFALGHSITKYRHSVKAEYKVAEGIRTFRNVFGNGGAAIVFSVLFFFNNLPIMLLGVVGAMATATADTFATEVGQAHERNPRLITTGKNVEVGVSGGVSLPGSFAALIGAALISLIPLLMGRDEIVFVIGTLAGFLGCMIDSIIGATIESKGLDTHITNFISTTAGGIIAITLGLYLHIFI